MTIPRAKLDHAVVALLFVAGFAFLFRRWLFTGFDGIFGDEADGEILIAFVEHWHRVFAGMSHWTDVGFLYPEPRTLGISDALFLYGAVHAALRFLGLDVFSAYMMVMAGLAVVGFFGFLRLARRHLGLATPWAALGAFLFAFANVDAVKLIHAQAYCAMLLPVLCDLVLTAWTQSRRLRGAAFAGAAGLLHGLIFFTAFQTAWFFALFVVFFAVLHPLVFGPARTLAVLREGTAKWHIAAAFAAGFAVGIAPFLVLYVPLALAGRHRELSEIFSNSPDARDILNVTPGNWVWGELLRHAGITGRPNRPWWEVELGFTPAVVAVFVVTIAVLMMARRRTTEEPSADDRWFLLLGLGLLVSWLLQLDYAGFRPWTLIYRIIPGATGIRYTFRSQIVGNLFAALVVARGMAGLAASARGRPLIRAITGAAVVLLVVEQINLDWPATISRRKMTALIDGIPPPPAGCRVFYLVPGVEPKDKPGYALQAEAIFIAQLRGWPTVNGDSSWLPEGWNLQEPNAPGYAAAVRDWAARKNIAGLCGLDPQNRQWTIGLP